MASGLCLSIRHITLLPPLMPSILRISCFLELLAVAVAVPTSTSSTGALPPSIPDRGDVTSSSHATTVGIIIFGILLGLVFLLLLVAFLPRLRQRRIQPPPQDPSSLPSASLDHPTPDNSGMFTDPAAGSSFLSLSEEAPTDLPRASTSHARHHSANSAPQDSSMPSVPRPSRKNRDRTYDPSTSMTEIQRSLPSSARTSNTVPQVPRTKRQREMLTNTQNTSTNSHSQIPSTSNVRPRSELRHDPTDVIATLNSFSRLTSKEKRAVLSMLNHLITPDNSRRRNGRHNDVPQAGPPPYDS